MDNYMIERLRCDAQHILDLAKVEGKLAHAGLRGRFREILIDNMLAPWLPHAVACGTGTVIAVRNPSRKHTQDDVIIYDRSLAPAVLASNQGGTEGVFLFNSVLARIEVKSKVTREDLRAFVRASLEMGGLPFNTATEQKLEDVYKYNMLFAFNSDLKNTKDPDCQLKRLIDVMKELKVQDPACGIVSMICIPPFGFWKIGLQDGKQIWQRLNLPDPRDRIVWFVGCLSSMTFGEHAARHGHVRNKGVAGGVGGYLPDDCFVQAIV